MKSNNFFGKNIFIALALFIATGSFNTVFAAVPSPTFNDPTTGMQFIYIPGGTFVMGDPTGKDPFAVPAHEVTVKPFYLGKYEVTFAEYDKFASDTKRLLPDDAGWGRGIRPVINVGWSDAVAFTEWLSKKTGKKFRLPSESEWEFAARGKTTSIFYWGDALGRSNANCKGCGSPWDDSQTAAVGSFSPNPFGLYDMTGNVYEWCLDTRHRNYEGAPRDGKPWISKKDKNFRINRGGSWFQPTREMPVYRRCWDRIDQTRAELGFRVLLEP